MALGQRVKICVLLAVVVALPLCSIAVAAGALDWIGPPPNLNALMAGLQLAGAGFAAVTAVRRCDED